MEFTEKSEIHQEQNSTAETDFSVRKFKQIIEICHLNQKYVYLNKCCDIFFACFVKL